MAAEAVACEERKKMPDSARFLIRWILRKQAGDAPHTQSEPAHAWQDKRCMALVHAT